MFLGVVYKIVQFNPYVKIPMIPLEYQLLEGEYNSMIRIMTILKTCLQQQKCLDNQEETNFRIIASLFQNYKTLFSKDCYKSIIYIINESKKVKKQKKMKDPCPCFRDISQ